MINFVNEISLSYKKALGKTFIDKDVIQQLDTK